MKTLTLILMALLSMQVGAAPHSHGKHKGPQPSLLAECQSAAALPSPHCGRTPTAVFGDDGILYVVFSQHGHIYLTRSQDLGNSFEAASVINRTPELIYDDGENRPKIVLGEDRQVFVSWTHKTPGRYSGDVRFARSLDGGQTFDKPITVNSDRALISHRFDAMILDAQQRLYLIWIDKRDQAAAKRNKQSYTGAALYLAVSDDAGASFGPNQKLVDHSCECCRIAVDRDSDGQVVALWRHVYPVNIRDHAIARVIAEDLPIKGQPVRASDDDWLIDGCPHHGPDLSIDAAGKAHMAWFSQGNNQRGMIYGQFDFDDMQTHRVTSIDASPAAARPQVQVLGDSVMLMWKRFNGQHMELLIKRSGDDGNSWSEAEIIATTEHASDHPDWLRHGDKLYASWHTQAEGMRLIPVELQ